MGRGASISATSTMHAQPSKKVAKPSQKATIPRKHRNYTGMFWHRYKHVRTGGARALQMQSQTPFLTVTRTWVVVRLT